MDKYLGKRLDGRYEMRELIGIGGMAYVYKAYDSVNDRVVAVKILKDEYLNNQEFVRRFRNESKAIAILNHENIVKVLDVGFGERLQYIVMEYIDGITLKEYLDQRKEIRWKEAVHFAIQILRALQHAHDKGIVHRDIKPQNVMLLSDGTIKVTDFGIARLTRSEMQVTVVGNKAIGSVHYISPEQARGELTDEKADLYSVGIVLYEMLTGKLPFEADNAVSVAIMQMQSEAKAPHLLNNEIPSGLEQITLKAMQKDTARRYQSAAEMLSDFDEFKRNPSIQFEYTYFEDATPTRYVDAITRVRGVEPETVKADKKTDDKKTKEKNAKEKKKKVGMSVTDVILPIVAAVFVVAIIALVLVLTGVLGAEGEDKVDVKVPKFINLSYEEAEELAAEYGLTVKFIYDEEYKTEFDDGEVFNQRPAEGESIKVDSTVELYVNQLPLIDVPFNRFKVGKTTFEEVFDVLTKAGFNVEKAYDTEFDPELGDDTFVRLEPAEARLKQGEKITVIVNGTEEEKGILPMIYSENHSLHLDDAVKKLQANNFLRNGIEPTIIYVNDDSGYPKDTVIKMSPEAGEEYEFDGEIELTVVSGYRDVILELTELEQIQNIDEVVSFKVYINEEENEEFSKKIKPLRPSTTMNLSEKTLAITGLTDEDFAQYEVRVELYVSNEIIGYLVFDANGETGEYSLVENGLPTISEQAAFGVGDFGAVA